MAGSVPKAADIFDIRGKTVLVIGSSSGIGRALALFLGEQGANIIAAARRTDKLQELVASINAGAGKAEVVSLDVSAGEDDIAQKVDQAWGLFGRIDILVNSAGVFEGGPVLETSQAVFDNTFTINVRGLLLVAREVAKKQAADGKGGSIINISSILGNDTFFPGAAVYAASKAAVTALTRALALELGSQKITVNAVHPGVFDTDMAKALVEHPQNTSKQLPLGRFGNPDYDLSGVVLLLASPAGAYITGVSIAVDGGHSVVGLHPIQM